MAQAQEYLTSNRKIRFPFADDSSLNYSEGDDPGIQNEKSLLVFGCFVDALIQPLNSNIVTTPLITNITIQGTTISFTLTQEETPSFTERLTCAASDILFPIIQGKTSWCWYVFVLSSDGIRELSSQADYIGDISTSILRFNTRCLTSYPTGVTSLKVYSGDKINQSTGSRYSVYDILATPPDAVLKENISLHEGYNTSLTQPPTLLSIDDTDQTCSIAAVPGAGLGVKVCGDEPTSENTSVSGFYSADGHSCLYNDTCYDFFPVKMSEEKAYLYLQAKCTACCTCEMYEDIVNNKLIPLKTEILNAQQSLNSSLELYEENVKKWNIRLKKVYPEDIIISTVGIPLDAAATNLSSSTIRGKMNRCGFSVTVRNNSFVTVKASFQKLMTTGTLHELQVSYIDEELNPYVDVLGEKVPEKDYTLLPGRSLILTGFIRGRNLVRTDVASGFILGLDVIIKQGDSIVLTRKQELAI